MNLNLVTFNKFCLEFCRFSFDDFTPLIVKASMRWFKKNPCDEVGTPVACLNIIETVFSIPAR